MAEQVDSEKNQTDLSVVDRVLTEFVEAVEAEDGYKEIADRLHQALLAKKDLSEASLERALFNEGSQ